MITQYEKTEIRRLFYGEHWKVGTIADHLRLHSKTVKRALEFSERKKPDRKSESCLKPYIGFIDSVIETHPTLRATRLLQMLKERGYGGSVYPIRRYLRSTRPRAKRAFQDLHFFPGEVGQLDWADFGRFEVTPGVFRRLNCFVMVLSHSRRLFAKVYFDQKQGTLLEAHASAFSYFGGSPRIMLYDNMATAVVRNMGAGVQFTNSLLEVAAHYHFKPRACNPRSGWEKGRVEKAIRYIRDNFSPPSRKFNDLESLNAQLIEWMSEVADKRRWVEDTSKSVLEAFSEEDLRVPSCEFDGYLERTVKVDKKARVRFDTNIYSVPHNLVGETLIIRACSRTIRIYFDEKLLCTHNRCWSKKQKVVIADHVDNLISDQHIRKTRQHRCELVRSFAAGSLLIKEWNRIEESLIAQSNALLELAKLYPGQAIDNAIKEAIARGTPRVDSIAYILQRKPDQLPIAKVSFKNSTLNNILVEQHDLSLYDTL